MSRLEKPTLRELLGLRVLVAGVVLVAASCATPPAPDDSAALMAAAIDARIRETAAQVHERARSLTEIPQLVTAVSTDAATMRDLALYQPAMQPRPRESIIVAQFSKSGKPVVLMALPSGATPPVTFGPGIRVAVREGKLMFTEVVRIEPPAGAEGLAGALAVTAAIDLSATSARLDGLKRSARLTVGGVAMSVGAKAMREGAATTSKRLANEAAGDALLEVESAASGSPSLVLQVLPLALVLALLALVALLVRRRPTAVTASPAVATRSISTPAPRSSPAPAPVAMNAISRDAPTMMDADSGQTVVEGDGGPTAAPTDAARSGERHIGQYAILKRLGSGGMAEVFLARSEGAAGFEKLIALKVMKAELTKKPIIVEHFLDEARLASGLTHPNVVHITDLGRAGDDYYIAMEYVEGADLARLKKRCVRNHTTVPFRIALTIIRKICDGLHAAHMATDSSGKLLDLVHRDVKSANVFVGRNGGVKVGDFGIAKANQVVNEAKRTAVGQIKGTPRYMAPEQRLAKPVDKRADVFGVGAIAYELLAGIDITLDLLLLARLGVEGWPHQTPPSHVRPELPPALDAIVWKALAFDRADRYATCAELEDALEAVANQYPPVASEKAVAHWVEAELVAEAVEEAAAPVVDEA